jgi:hypothetical protein
VTRRTSATLEGPRLRRCGPFAGSQTSPARKNFHVVTTTRCALCGAPQISERDALQHLREDHSKLYELVAARTAGASAIRPNGGRGVDAVRAAAGVRGHSA